ncbi:MAG: toll/interleukin-1 receptor domain-containing protein [Bacteroidaceae bacterium]|nr:toll/interleukin-1 receptor domain-containing protein [Bacteroidaceae bacterium]
MKNILVVYFAYKYYIYISVLIALIMEDLFDFASIDINENQDESSWDALIEQIIAGNVIPVIGSSVLVNNCDIHEKLISSLANQFCPNNKNVHSFSDLMFDHDYLKKVGSNSDYTYTLINKFFQKNASPASDLLSDILSIKQFPFVITTSFTPIVENKMKEIWTDLRVMKFSNNPKENYDISNENDMRKPTVYYMFGRVGDPAHRYVLTDTDILDFCSSWLSDGKRPKNLVNALKNKYLLMLGNNYSDWLFRFIWYSIRRNSANESLFVNSQTDHKLCKFLERNHTFLQEDPQRVISEIKDRLSKRIKENESTKFNTIERNADVFISYSRSDSQIAQELYDKLTQLGLRVWFDRNDITSGGNFLSEIKEGIRSARYFVPILSHNIEIEKNDQHVYRNEWEYAIDVAISLGRSYIIPICEKGFDFYKSNIPEKLRQHNAIEYEKGSDCMQIAEKIFHTMNLE